MARTVANGLYTDQQIGQLYELMQATKKFEDDAAAVELLEGKLGKEDK